MKDPTLFIEPLNNGNSWKVTFRKGDEEYVATFTNIVYFLQVLHSFHRIAQSWIDISLENIEDLIRDFFQDPEEIYAPYLKSMIDENGRLITLEQLFEKGIEDAE